MRRRNFKQTFSVNFFIFIILLTIPLFQYQIFRHFPTHIYLPMGEKQDLTIGLPFIVSIQSDQNGLLRINGTNVNYKINNLDLRTPLCLESARVGKVNLEFRLFNIFTVKRMIVEAIPSLKVIPGGDAIGVLLKAEGVMVVGFSSVTDASGTTFVPAREAGVYIGDTIVKINGNTIRSTDDAGLYINEMGRDGRPVKITVQRAKAFMDFTIKPVLCRETGKYRIGLYIKDTAAGVGTLSFIEPKTRKYGALGHVIMDSETNSELTIDDGKVVKASISGIQPGRKGVPGEKIGTFVPEENEIVGKIIKNCRFGIYGIMQSMPRKTVYNRPISIALSHQIHRGPAEILTVIQGDQVEKFKIEILKVANQFRPDGRGLVIKVVDPILLRKTGGIVQGMSGSPIIQDNRFVGAVTHVFINDPTKGYGVLAEWMILEAGLIRPASQAS